MEPKLTLTDSEQTAVWSSIIDDGESVEYLEKTYDIELPLGVKTSENRVFMDELDTYQALIIGWIAAKRDER